MSVLRSTRRTAVMGMLVLLSAAAMAAPAEEEAADALLDCAAVTDDARRLECFDEKLAELPPQPVVEDVVESAPAATVELEQSASPPAVDDPSAAASGLDQAATPPAAAAAPAATSAVDDFGMTDKVASQSSDTDQPVKLTEITATATEVRKRPGGEHIVTLDNGQVWTEKRVEPRFRVKAGDTVIIKKGRMGGYRMIRGYYSSEAVRVE